MADWIASNEKYFPLLSLEVSMVNNPEARVLNGFKKWRGNNSHPWEATWSAPNTIYNERFGFMPRNVQSVFAEVIETSENLASSSLKRLWDSEKQRQHLLPLSS